jgi:hypothetical protein
MINGFIRPNTSMAEYVNGVFIKDIRNFVQTLSERILPSFNNLESEAELYKEKEYERLCYHSCDEEGVLAELAFENSADWFASMSKIKQSLINLHSVGLNHLFEQQLYDLSYAGHFDSVGQRNTGNKKDKRNIEDKKKLRYASYEYDKKLLLDVGNINIEILDGWNEITKLRTICNTIKHAEGHSSSKLRKQYHDLFICPDILYKDIALRNINHPNHSAITTPMSGEGIYLTENHILAYGDAIELFWKSFIRWVIEDN